jgi:gamma-glutamyltranspeptidase/glutathione hydrolase
MNRTTIAGGPVAALLLIAAVGCTAPEPTPAVADLSPAIWQADYDQFMAAQLVERASAGVATGSSGAVTVAYNGLAARAGLEALKQGGNAIDAAMTTVLAQVALTGGAPISYFGIMSLVYYDAATGDVHTMGRGRPHVDPGRHRHVLRERHLRHRRERADGAGRRLHEGRGRGP